jgi:hypothetical protein
MRIKTNSLLIISLFAAIAILSCATTRQNDFSNYNFTLNNTLSIFLINNEKDNYFCIPVQYVGEYHMSRFEFDNGNVLIGDYDIPLKRDDLNISVYLNEAEDEDGNTAGEFYMIYQEKNGKVLANKMAEPLTEKKDPNFIMSHYYIFIEKRLTDNEMNNIVNEYKRKNVQSQMSIWYDLTIDNEEQNGSGILDTFELYDGPGIDPSFFPSNLDFFKSKYL